MKKQDPTERLLAESTRLLFDDLSDRMVAAQRREADQALTQVASVRDAYNVLIGLGVDVVVQGYGVKDGKPPTGLVADTFSSNQMARSALADVVTATQLPTSGVCTCDLQSYTPGADKKGEVTAKLVGPSGDITLQLRYWKQPPEAE